MRKTFAFLLIFLPTLVFGQGDKNLVNRLVFLNVTLIDMRSEKPRSGMTVVVDGDRIAKIGRNIKIPKAAEVVDATGKFLIPGLWDSYTYTLDAVQEGNPFLEMMIAYGVTSVRDAGNSTEPAQAERLRNDIDAGRIIAPRLFYGGRHVNGTNLTETGALTSFQAKDAGEAARYVETLARNRVDYISLGSFLPPELVPAAVAAAKKYKLPVVQWVTMNGYADASNAGVSCIEHFADFYRTTSARRNEYFSFNRERRSRMMTPDEIYKFFNILRDVPDQKYFDQTLRTLARNKTCVITNFAEGGHSAEVLEFTDLSRRRYKTKKQLEELEAAIKEIERQRAVKDFRLTTAWKGLLQDIGALHKAGVPLVAGTQSDEGAVTSPGIWLHDELYWFVQAGLTPFEALKTATVNPAIFMRREKDLGTIEKGKLADLILLDSDPRADISNTRKINSVVVNGRLLNRKALDKLLSDVEAKAKQNN
jgi:imidazolonepropionase-like amidohydrolase